MCLCCTTTYKAGPPKSEIVMDGSCIFSSVYNTQKCRVGLGLAGFVSFYQWSYD